MIDIYDKNDHRLRSFSFNYNNNALERLFLIRKGIGENGEEKIYTFYYNTTPLPLYNSGQIDHLRVYKGGKSYFSENISNIYNNRSIKDSDLNNMKAGILTTIKYPTGGTTTFDYELNDYSSVIKRYPIDVVNQEIDSITGGLRVRKITTKDSDGATVLSEKEYYYVKNYVAGSTLSSGILAGKPEYDELWGM